MMKNLLIRGAQPSGSQPLVARLWEPATVRLAPSAARATDAPAIAALLRQGAPNTIAVPAAEIAGRIDRYEVVRHPRFGVVASVAVLPVEGLGSELRSLVVAPEWEGHGLGALLVARTVLRSLAEGRWLACVTLRPDFFAALGFVPVPLSSLPAKPGRGAVVDGRPRVAMAWSATCDLAA